MPVIECGCGMVISVPKGVAPVRCLRCGKATAAAGGIGRLTEPFGPAEARAALTPVLVRHTVLFVRGRVAGPAEGQEWKQDGSPF